MRRVEQLGPIILDHGVSDQSSTEPRQYESKQSQSVNGDPETPNPFDGDSPSALRHPPEENQMRGRYIQGGAWVG